MTFVEIIATEELGDRSYVAHDGVDAIVVDPQRDLDRVEKVLDRHQLTLGLVLETHVHNDYVTGGFELARRTGAQYVLSGADDVTFARHPITDGEALECGSLRVRALSTPGHTGTHMAYVVSDRSDPTRGPAVFTGGSLLFGSVGRTDLLGTARTEELTRAQYRSANRLAVELSPDTAVYPTHGFGSFCSAGSTSGGDASTIGLERQGNDALTERDEDVFVERLIASLTAYPAYYAHMAPLNRLGPRAPDLSPAASIDPAELRSRIADGQWVVDLRDRVAYARHHVKDTVSMALGSQFATYLGWLVPWGSPVTLVGESREQIADAQRQLVRIGIDRLAGAAIGQPAQLARPDEVRSYPRGTFAELTTRLDASAPASPSASDGTASPVVVLDVRRDDEHAASAIRGSVHVPLHELVGRLDELPEGQIWVHCASGWRSSIATSLLARAGRDVVYIDDDFECAVDANLTD